MTGLEPGDVFRYPGLSTEWTVWVRALDDRWLGLGGAEATDADVLQAMKESCDWELIKHGHQDRLRRQAVNRDRFVTVSLPSEPVGNDMTRHADTG
jgi:hypothetical protein